MFAIEGQSFSDCKIDEENPTFFVSIGIFIGEPDVLLLLSTPDLLVNIVPVLFVKIFGIESPPLFFDNFVGGVEIDYFVRVTLSLLDEREEALKFSSLKSDYAKLSSLFYSPTSSGSCFF
jgi:hypothetical protein